MNLFSTPKKCFNPHCNGWNIFSWARSHVIAPPGPGHTWPGASHTSHTATLSLRGPDWTVALAMWQWSWPETRLTHCHIATVAGPLPAQYSLAELLYSYNSGRSCHCCIIAQSTITILTLLLQPNFPDYKEAIKYMLHQAIVHFIAQEAKMVPFFCLFTDIYAFKKLIYIY